MAGQPRRGTRKNRFSLLPLALLAETEAEAAKQKFGGLPRRIPCWDVPRNDSY
jgi:hypothetical protein